MNIDEIGDEGGFSGSELFIAGTSLFLCFMMFYAGGILATGITTGIVSAIGFGYVLLKSRNGAKGARVWNTIMDNQAAADMAISLGFVLLMGTTTSTGIISGAVAAICSSALITFGGKFLGSVPDVAPLTLRFKKQ
jgi:hypothetical protein